MLVAMIMYVARRCRFEINRAHAKPQAFMVMGKFIILG